MSAVAENRLKYPFLYKFVEMTIGFLSKIQKLLTGKFVRDFLNIFYEFWT